MFDKIDELGVNTLRTLSMDMIQKANSGHPGLPMGAAPMAYALWTKHLKVNPKTSRNWIDRDRFILSAGHGSALQYSLLHMAGYDVTIEDIKNFRQWESRTPGHPEVHHTDGIEATTGPLGQGIAMSVGFAMAEAHLAATYNRPNYKVMDHYTYAICGDGDLMEGISQEAISLAGHLKLDKLIVLYDSNDISLDGDLDKSFSEDVKGRFEATGWQHILVKDGNDLAAISKAIDEAKAETNKPTIIEVKTVIGFGAPNAGTNKVHGAPLGMDGIATAKAAYGWEYEAFEVPTEAKERFEATINANGEAAEAQWNELFASYQAEYPELAAQLLAGFANELPENWDAEMPIYQEADAAKASRVTSSEMIQALAKTVPTLWGGSADLSGSNNTMIAGETDFDADHYEGRNIWFGVREFAMAAAMNGIALHGGTKVYGGTFFVFVDYLRPAIRLASIQKAPVTYVLTHDSVAVGEDGPTHEPIEQLSSLRGLPNLNTIRPADGNETRAAWKIAISSTERPTVLALTRQNLPVLPNSAELADEGVAKGAYVISPAKGDATGILIATGSEVALAIEAQKVLAEQGEDVSVVSMPSMNLFEEQSVEYKEAVLPRRLTKRVAIEMGATFGWERYVGFDGAVMGIDKFGASAPGNIVIEQYGFTVDNVVKTYNEL
ncbi:transketolase [Vagococcus xieshaowenii]|uniref:Transketolase n=1 Tax=Vagococcus xieshaowenii TaxID=2562451 RepID=A0AAJ5JLJ8_9ENTE|nr:transketolase [Vagococcus xieshaowenii]QCA29589.1 transketolase [Vagococcus xieshaowenii]TFZ42879.1 transketolase [Vagococcus xieshaowenii]